ncbi:hypothetical protein C8T65DRAFT_751353 [Cerioporus squamosus]|nr:hypothetical protein C8T65DRAFT_751353 [Cerioporus squamosus]
MDSSEHARAPARHPARARTHNPARAPARAPHTIPHAHHTRTAPAPAPHPHPHAHLHAPPHAPSHTPLPAPPRPNPHLNPALDPTPHPPSRPSTMSPLLIASDLEPHMVRTPPLDMIGTVQGSGAPCNTALSHGAMEMDTSGGPGMAGPPHPEAGDAADIDPRILDYLCSRFPARLSELHSLGAKYGTAYARFIHVKIINGALRDLGLGTGSNETQQRSVRDDTGWLTIGTYDVVRALKAKPQSFRVWRSNVRLANWLYLWMDCHRRDWLHDTPDGREFTELFEALHKFFGAERLPALDDARANMGEDPRVMTSDARSELALQRARGWSATTMEDDVKDIIRKLVLSRKKLPPPWPLLD